MKNSISIIMILCATTALSILGGCGSGGGGSQGTVTTTPSNPTVANNTYSLSEDAYGLQKATFMSATNNNGAFVMRAAIADNMTDPDFRTVFRIDIVQPQLINGPGTYAIGSSGSPVEILFFNGHQSTLLNTASGTITFTSYGVNPGAVVSGSFEAVVEDQNSDHDPIPTYPVKGSFNFVVNTSGSLVPTPIPVPVAAAGYYNGKCASCHSLGSLDPMSAGGAPDLALEGGEIPDHFTAGQPGHKAITLTAEEINDLKILLNAN